VFASFPEEELQRCGDVLRSGNSQGLRRATVNKAGDLTVGVVLISILLYGCFVA
jgi:hypothetical protein